jgi:hypothetical protein
MAICYLAISINYTFQTQFAWFSHRQAPKVYRRSPAWCSGQIGGANIL